MRNRKEIISAFFVLFFVFGFSQESIIENDSIKEGLDKKIEFTVDVVSRYLWRGQCWGGDYVAIQPTIEYVITPKLAVGCWATTNFKKDYFYPDGETSYKGYHEIDFYATYQINDFLQFQIWDYYWPSVSKVEGVNNSFFNYGHQSVKTIDAILYFDFSEGYKYPFNATISTFLSGNDYRYNINGEKPKRNYTTYVEFGYTFTLFENTMFKFIQNIELSPVVGAVLNNQAEYYSNGDYDKVSFVNLGAKAIKEIDLAKGIIMPLSLSFTHNAASRNTESFGRNFLVAGLSLKY